jgi:outer membrane lipoprotein-sorting protein
MKKTLITHILFLIVLIPALGQERQAGEILREVADLTRSYETIQVKFSYNMDNADAGIHEKYDGKLLIRGDMYRLEVGGQLVITDGKTIWTYIRDAEEVQIHSAEDHSEAITPSNLFTSYHEDYRSKLIREGLENGKPSYVIDLIPNTGKSFFKVRVIVEKQKKHISSFAIYERNGSIFTYQIKEFTPNVKAEPSLFRFQKSEFPEADIIDMR